MGFESTTFSVGNDPRPRLHADFAPLRGDTRCHVSQGVPVDAAEV